MTSTGSSSQTARARRHVRLALLAVLFGTLAAAVSTASPAAHLGVGAAPASRTLSVVAIGDSIPYGRFDCGNCATFVDLFAQALARRAGTEVRVQNLSEHTGIDSTDLRKQLTTNRRLRAAVSGADAITITIGHNDPPWNSFHDSCDGKSGYPTAAWDRYDRRCLHTEAAAFRRNLDAILHTVRSLRAGKPTLLRVTNDYNDLIGDPKVPTSAYPIAKRFFDTYSAIDCKLARTYGGVCIDTYHAFNGPHGVRDAGRLLAPDHTHPNAAGHQLIAHLLEQAGYRPLHS